MSQLRKTPANASKVNQGIERRIGYANKVDGKNKRQPEELRALIAQHIATVARERGLGIRDVPFPDPEEWGQRKGLLPEATRVRLLNPDKYSDAPSAIEGEFRRTQGDMLKLLPPDTQSRLAELSVQYSLWFPPHDRPANVLNTKVQVSRGADTDKLIGCFVAPKTVLNAYQLAKLAPGTIGPPTQEDIRTAGILGRCPFMMPEGVILCVDSSVKALNEIAVNAGVPDEQAMLTLPPAELAKLPQGIHFVPGLARVK